MLKNFVKMVSCAMQIFSWFLEDKCKNLTFFYAYAKNTKFYFKKLFNFCHFFKKFLMALSATRHSNTVFFLIFLINLLVKSGGFF